MVKTVQHPDVNHFEAIRDILKPHDANLMRAFQPPPRVGCLAGGVFGDGIAREHGERPSYAVWRGISDIDADQPVGEDRCFVIVTATLS